jgi:hypothetical protein
MLILGTIFVVWAAVAAVFVAACIAAARSDRAAALPAIHTRRTITLARIRADSRRMRSLA